MNLDSFIPSKIAYQYIESFIPLT